LCDAVGHSLVEGVCFPRSCLVVLANDENAKTGSYTIDPDGLGGVEPVDVFCDMDTNDGAAYTYHRIDSEELLGEQAAYREACAEVGLEVVVPRTAEHYKAMTLWNGDVAPNLVNVFPMVDYAASLSRWIGRCGGRDCSFHITGTGSADCLFEGEEPSGENLTTEALYRMDSAECAPVGRWDDAHDAVAIPGWVICSTNDALLLRSCQDRAMILRSLGVTPEDGETVIDPDGPGGDPPANVWCEMSFEGGGWTLVLSSNGLGPSELSESADGAVLPLSSTYLAPELTSALARSARSVHIRTRGDVTRSITSVDPQVVLNLRSGISLERQTSPASWRGPFAEASYLDHEVCPSYRYFPDVFDGCGPSGEFQLVDDLSRWTVMSGPEPLEVYLR
jgi:hypothetical protein